MSASVVLASFATDADLLEAVRAVRARNWHVDDVYAPFPVHGLEDALGWRHSRLAAACLFGGVVGAGFALWFQFWTTATDWPLNIGGRPWNSLPAFVPVTFECMVLLGGFAMLFAWLLRCDLYPGKAAMVPLKGVTDDRFGLAIRVPEASSSDEVQRLLQDCRALEIRHESAGDIDQ
jgi:hypothetical protein